MDCGLELGTKEALLGKDYGADKPDLSTSDGAEALRLDAEQIGPRVDWRPSSSRSAVSICASISSQSRRLGKMSVMVVLMEIDRPRFRESDDGVHGGEQVTALHLQRM